ncbi:MAG: 2-oxoacid:acceptor oxidoreductase subunit alpha [Phototrophicaceae bacterium]
MQNASQVRVEGRIVNDFSFTVATKNGSGSQTSNAVLIRSLFKMGIPVNGKNLFPSNIKGLPTWYTIRVSKDGYTARRDSTEIMVAMNQDTAAEDIQRTPAGGVVILPQEWKWTQSREDIVYYEIPVKDLLKEANVRPELRDRIANMVYVGAVAQLFGISIDTVYGALLDNFGGRAKLADANFPLVKMAYEWSVANLEKRDPYLFEVMDGTAGKILIEGNEAAALGSLFGGVSVVAWYPITPSTSLVDAIIKHKKIRIDPETKQETVAVVQAEDELAAIGMLVGAGWAGTRAMTATSGPGISLMAEFTGLAQFAEIPCVIWDVTRMGPSTGLPTRTSQGDITFLYNLGHGDSRQIVLLPATVAECFEFGWRAFDVAEHFQTPIFVASDLDLGMNLWMSDPFEYPTEPMNRGKVIDAAGLDAFQDKYGSLWGRYKDVDGDSITYRTLPGTDHPFGAYFTRGTGHNDMAAYSERGEDWVANMERLHQKFESSRDLLPQPTLTGTGTAKVGIISFGSNDPAILEGQDRLAEHGIETDYLRVRALPVPQSVYDFIASHEQVYVIENNFDGQLARILRSETDIATKHMKSVPLGDSLPMTPKFVTETILKHQEQAK